MEHTASYDIHSLEEEILFLKKELNEERRLHKHWESLAMIFHDALWKELKARNV